MLKTLLEIAGGLALIVLIVFMLAVLVLTVIKAVEIARGGDRHGRD